MHEIRRIAFFGLGRMGMPFATNLVRQGFEVIGYDTSEIARNSFAEIGAVAATPGDAIATADCVITMLPDGKIVEAVISDVLASLQDGVPVIDMSSSAPVGTRTLGQRLAAANHALIDAPVSGGVAKAIEGTVAIMVGGPPEAIDRALPVFNAIGSKIFRTGALGSGHAVKALNNFVSAAGLQAACEALAVAQAFGVDGDTLIDVLNASTGRNNSTETKMKPHVLSQTFASGFSLGLMAKDVGTANDLAEVLGVPAPALNTAAKLWKQAATALPDGDHTEIYRATGSQ